MRPFEYVAPVGLEQVPGALAEGTALKAGGLDLLDLMKEGIDQHERLVSLASVVSGRIEQSPDGSLVIGAGATLASLGSHPLVLRHHPALARAALEAATPQVRNQATLAGNVLQRSRCLYYRLADFPCRKKGGDTCYARGGEHHHCGVFDTDLCPAVHPSNTAVPLIAAGATVEIWKDGKLRSLTLEEALVGPAEDVTREHRLAPGEIVTTVSVPRSDWACGYNEVRQRRGADWALVSAAAYLRMEGDQVSEARVVAGFVAPTPRRLGSVEAALVGGPLSASRVRAAVADAFSEALPLPQTRYKVPMGKACIERAILACAEGSDR